MDNDNNTTFTNASEETNASTGSTQANPQNGVPTDDQSTVPASNNESADEALEATNDQDYDTDVGYKNILPEDNSRPFEPTTNPNVDKMPIDHPVTDSGVDLHEQYDAGVSEASGYTTQTEEPNREDS
jgi:hypothetical protein